MNAMSAEMLLLRDSFSARIESMVCASGAGSAAKSGTEKTMQEISARRTPDPGATPIPCREYTAFPFPR